MERVLIIRSKYGLPLIASFGQTVGPRTFSRHTKDPSCPLNFKGWEHNHVRICHLALECVVIGFQVQKREENSSNVKLPL